MSRGPDGRFVTAPESQTDGCDSGAVTCAGCGADLVIGLSTVYIDADRCQANPTGAVRHRCESCYRREDDPYRYGNGHCWGYGRFSLRACRRCGAEFYCNRHRRFCSVECRTAAMFARRRERRRTRQRTCQHCATPYRPARSDSAYCSAACRQRAYRRRVTKAATERREFAEMVRAYEARLRGWSP